MLWLHAVRLRHDPDLTVLIANCHINGRPNVFEHYQPDELAKTIADPRDMALGLVRPHHKFPLTKSNSKEIENG